MDVKGLDHTSRMTNRSATATAPCTVGNVGVGFDVLGHAVVALRDRVTVTVSDRPGVRVLRPGDTCLPTDPALNTASAGLVRLAADLSLPFGLDVEVEKGIPVGSGMGGSAASAAAAIIAASALLHRPLDERGLLCYGMYGEQAATGSFHADNLAPSLLGGLVLASPTDPTEVVRIPVPGALRCVVVHPDLRVDTRDARRLIPAELPLRAHVEQSARLAALIAGCFAGDMELIGRVLADHLIEPHRAPLVPGFAAVKAAALDAGALGCTLSGSGPSVFAWCDGDVAAAGVAAVMVDAFASTGVAARAWISPVDAPGAALVAPGAAREEGVA